MDAFNSAADVVRVPPPSPPPSHTPLFLLLLGVSAQLDGVCDDGLQARDHTAESTAGTTTTCLSQSRFELHHLYIAVLCYAVLCILRVSFTLGFIVLSLLSGNGIAQTTNSFRTNFYSILGSRGNSASSENLILYVHEPSAVPCTSCNATKVHGPCTRIMLRSRGKPQYSVSGQKGAHITTSLRPQILYSI